MTAGELAAWLTGHGWYVVASTPGAVVATRGQQRYVYAKRNDAWCIVARKGRRPGAREEDELS